MNKLTQLLIPGFLVYLFTVGFACSNQMASFRAGGLYTPLQPKPATFAQLAVELGSRTEGQPVTYALREIAVKPEVKPQCVVGELDIVAAAIACHIKAPFIVSVKDQQREVSLLKFQLDGGQDINALNAQLSNLLVRTVVGDEVDIFACIDSNNNGLCTDEPIIDLNKATADILNGAATAVCDQTKFGVLLYHKHHSFNPGGAMVTVPTMDPASQVVQGALRNLATTGPAAIDPAGRPTLPVPLVKANHDLCPKPNVRMDGCFAKGTRVKLAHDVAVPIEKLHPGNRVMLADGRLAVIKRMTAGPESLPMIEIETSLGHKIMITSEHPLVTAKGVKMAKDIALGDQLKSGADGKFVSILSIGKKIYTDLVYNFEVEGSAAERDHLVIAEGLVSGELYLQNKLSNQGTVVPNSLSRR